MSNAQNVWAWAMFSDWDAVGGTTQVVEVLDGLTDAAGNPLPPQSLTLNVLQVPAPLAVHDFESSLTATTWGGTDTFAPEWIPGPDDRCEQGGCVFVIAPCDGAGGIAARVVTDGASQVKLRVRSESEWGAALLLRAVGTSGRDHTDGGYLLSASATWTELAIPVDNETEVGVSVVPWESCHWAQAEGAYVDRIWAE